MSFRLKIQVPDSIVVQADVAAISAADASGRFGLRPGHERFVTVLVPCILAYRDPTGREAYAAVDGGVLLLEHDQAQVVTREAVLADRLDNVTDAVVAMLASRRAEEHSARVTAEELATTLLREFRKAEQQR